MLIDWFTVGAQTLNFLVLVWLLKRFLYKPILDGIDAREGRIAMEMANADATKAEAQREQKEFQHKNEEFEQERAALLSRATDEAKAERQRLLDEARKAADALRDKRQESLRRGQQVLNDAIIRRTREEVFAITRKTLADLAGTTLEACMSEMFTRRLRGLEGEAKANLGAALGASSEPAVVCSAFDLPPEQQDAIHRALNETFSADVPVRFETKPDVISGIELSANGRKVAWSIADYLRSFEKSIAELLAGDSKAQGKSAAKADAPVDVKPSTAAKLAAPAGAA